MLTICLQIGIVRTTFIGHAYLATDATFAAYLPLLVGSAWNFGLTVLADGNEAFITDAALFAVTQSALDLEPLVWFAGFLVDTFSSDGNKRRIAHTLLSTRCFVTPVIVLFTGGALDYKVLIQVTGQFLSALSIDADVTICTDTFRRASLLNGNLIKSAIIVGRVYRGICTTISIRMTIIEEKSLVHLPGQSSTGLHLL